MMLSHRKVRRRLRRASLARQRGPVAAFRRLTGWLVTLALPLLLGVAVIWVVTTGSPDKPPEDPLTVNDITSLDPIRMRRVIAPQTVEEVMDIVKNTDGPIAIGGGRYSMGGQTGIAGGTQIDLRRLDRIIAFDSLGKTITVQAGIRWRDVQERIDPAGLSVKVMQTYANFTVGGSLSVNAHGRYVGQGALISSVRSIDLVLADGTRVTATPTENAELFHAAIGGYGGIGVIVEATLELADNVRLRRVNRTMPIAEYPDWFRRNVRDSARVVFHNADIYPNDFTTVNAVSYLETSDSVTVPERLIPRDRLYRRNQFLLWVISEVPGGKWLRRHLIDPLIFRGEHVSWRNHEASYDVAELEPINRRRSTYVLQEYFIPVERALEFVDRMRAIVRQHRANVINVSIRHARPDTGSLLSWARTEVFAFVMYFKQGTGSEARERVGTWTRALIDAATELGGSYYLPYQTWATPAQFAKGYPNARDYFLLKARVDPHHKFQNVLLEKYRPRDSLPSTSPGGRALRRRSRSGRRRRPGRSIPRSAAGRLSTPRTTTYHTSSRRGTLLMGGGAVTLAAGI